MRKGTPLACLFCSLGFAVFFSSASLESVVSSENNKGRGQNLSLFVQLLFAVRLTDLFKAWYNGLLLKVAGLFLCLSLC